jgi:hypothetical protein
VAFPSKLELTMDKMTFGDALAALKDGKLVAREGWNGKGMFLFLVPGSTFKVNRAPLLGIYPEGKQIDYHAHIDMRTATGEIVPWLCSQTDALAEDWCILGEASGASDVERSAEQATVTIGNEGHEQSGEPKTLRQPQPGEPEPLLPMLREIATVMRYASFGRTANRIERYIAWAEDV